MCHEVFDKLNILLIIQLLFFSAGLKLTLIGILMWLTDLASYALIIMDCYDELQLTSEMYGFIFYQYVDKFYDYWIFTKLWMAIGFTGLAIGL